MIQANDYLKNLTVHRQALHRIPELGRDLPRTKAYLASALAKLDCRLTFLCDTGICAFFDRGRRETRAFRADMDALPIAEATGADYRSRIPGRMHACGHDGHMAMVLTLGEAVDRIKDLPYNVLLIFQPAEETLGGAEEICRSGILEKYNVTGVFGFHLWPFFEAGTIATKPGAFMPKSSEINLRIHGRPAHGTAPYEGCDALYIATALIRDVYHTHGKLPGAIAHFEEGTGDLPTPIPAAPEDRTLIHFGKLESGYARNIVSDYAHILGTVRAYDEENFRRIIALIRDCAAQAEAEYGCKTDFTHSDGYPPVVNDLRLYETVLPVLEQLDFQEMNEPLVISEDFSFYGLYAPAVFSVLGTGTNIPLHSNQFDFDEKILCRGLAFYAALLKA